MKFKNLASVLALVVVSILTVWECQGSLSFIGNGYVILNPNGSGDTYYAVDDYNNPTYTGNLGGLTIVAGQSLLLGGEVQTFPQQFGTTAWIGYKLFQDSTLISENDQILLPYFSSAGNNDKWQLLPSNSNVDLAQNLSIGNYTLQVWFGAENNEKIFDNNNDDNFSASFSVVPEPTGIATGIFGLAGLAVLGWRKRKFVGNKIVARSGFNKARKPRN